MARKATTWAGMSGRALGLNWREGMTKKERERASKCASDPNFFREGYKYRSCSMAGQPNEMSYTLVYQSNELLVFTYNFQMRERVLSVYKSDLKDGDWYGGWGQDRSLSSDVSPD